MAVIDQIYVTSIEIEQHKNKNQDEVFIEITQILLALRLRNQ